MKRRSPRHPLTVFDKKWLEIARRTLKMPDAMVRVMGSMSKMEAREIIRELTGAKPGEEEENPRRRAAKRTTKRRRNLVYLEVGRGGKRGQKGFGIGVGYRARENRAKRNPLLGIFGANPRARVVRELGRVVEVRYKRKDDGRLYFHKYSSKPRLLALSDGSIWIKGA